MPEVPATGKKDIWPWNWTSYSIETVSIMVLAVFSMSLQYGKLDTTILLSTQLGVRIIGSLCLWFANRFTLEYILQSRIEANKVTQFLPFELTAASIAVTAIGYFIFYPIILYLNHADFQMVSFLRGLFLTCGLSLLIVIFYAGSQIWQSWWSDGELLFNPKPSLQPEQGSPDSITIKNAKGTIKQDLGEVLYFISESRIAFLVDSSGKKWTTQYTLSELEEMLVGKFFRLNRRILVSRQAITVTKKLPNHRLLVTIGPSTEQHQETISRYKSTRFKQWFGSNIDHSVTIP